MLGAGAKIPAALITIKTATITAGFVMTAVKSPRPGDFGKGGNMKIKLRLSPVKHVGDGKLPNRYWVSISNDYYYFDGECSNWISEKGLYPFEGKTIRDFGTFVNAQKFIDEELYLGMNYDGITVNSISIEDRISGEVWSSIQELYTPKADIRPFTHRDTGFTEQKMKEAGVIFR